ncbi:hypothetical protein OF83DRAFT_1089746, partial [Amylostereum chailletii]
MSQLRKRAPISPPLATHQRTKDVHPGLPDVAKPHKTTAEVKVKRLEQIEDDLAKESESRGMLSSPRVVERQTTAIPSRTQTSRKKPQWEADSPEVSSSPPVTKRRTAATLRKKHQQIDEASADGNDSQVEDDRGSKFFHRSNASDISKDAEDEDMAEDDAEDD